MGTKMYIMPTLVMNTRSHPHQPHPLHQVFVKKMNIGSHVFQLKNEASAVKVALAPGFTI